MPRTTLSVIAACTAACTACLLTACSSSSNSSHSTTSASAAKPASASPSASGPMNAATLARTMQAGTAGLTSAHLTLSATAAGQTLAGAGDETLSGGRLTALDFTEMVGSMSIGFRIVGGTAYAKLPAAAGGSAGKPWVKASATSTNPVLRQVAASIASAESNASLDGYRALAQAATSVKSDGPSSVGGVSATEYSLVVDLTKLPASVTSTQALKQAGLTSLPVSLWIDDQGRPVQVVENITVAGKAVRTTVTIGRFNAPITISAPPAGEIAAG